VTGGDEIAATVPVSGVSEGAPPSAASVKRRVALDVARIAIAGHLVQPMMFVSTLLVRRQIGPYLAGTLATLTLIQQYTQMSHLGVLQVAERDLPFLRGANALDRWARLRTLSLTLAMTAGVLTGLGMLLYAVVGRGHLGEPLFVGMLAYSLNSVLNQWSQSHLTFLRADHRFAFLSRNQVLFGFLVAVGNVAGAYVIGYPGVLLTTVVVSLLGCAAYTREVGFVAPQWTGIAADVRALLRTSLPLFALSLMAIGLHTIDSLVTLKVLGTEALGMYTLAVSGGNVVYGVANSAGVVVYPRMQESYGKEQRFSALARYVVGPTRLLAVGLPLVSAPLFFGIPAIITSFVPKFVPGILPFQILVVGVSFYALEGIPKLCFLSLGKIHLLMLWAGLTTAGCVGAMMLMPRGLMGVALGGTIGHLLAFLGVSTHVLRRTQPARATLVFLASAVLPIGYGAAVLAIVETCWPVARQHTFLGGALAAAIKLGVFLIAYAPLLWATESHTHLFRDYGLPIARRLRARFRR
jgi:O-antigen/teichoic acid export membrane protein